MSFFQGRLCIHFMQNQYNTSDSTMEDTLNEITSIRLFAGFSLDDTHPDHTTIMNFRHLFELAQSKLKLFKEVKKWQSDSDIYFKEEVIIGFPKNSMAFLPQTPLLRGD